jgi:hypothetical protein
MFVVWAIKSHWRVIGGIAVCALMLPLFLYQLYRAWAYQVINAPWSRRIYAVTLADHPIQFAISVAFEVVVVISVLAGLWFVVTRLRRELRNFRAKETRPPLDNAIREPFDRR